MTTTNVQNQLLPDKDSLFLIACEQNDTKLIKSLLNDGVDPKTCGHQAIIWALFKGNNRTVTLLSPHYKLQEISQIISNRFNQEDSKKFIGQIKAIKAKELNNLISKSKTKILEI
jgi:hypothetical protein